MIEKIKIHPYLFFVINLALLFSCSPKDCLEGSGAESEKTIQTGYFKEVNVNGIFEVYLVQDTSYYISFKGGSNMVEQSNATNTDSVVWMDNNSSCYFLKDYQKVKAYIHFNDIEAIHLKESCSVKTEKPVTDVITITAESILNDVDIELNTEHFFFYNHKTNAGVYKFKGWCNNCAILGYYSGKVDASNLNTNSMYIENHSAIDCSVRAQETVHAKIFSKGNIFVYGKPEIFVDSVAGSGKVIKVKEP
jgi:hypothetical protein